jgi:AcrR family transcriptional regulator
MAPYLRIVADIRQRIATGRLRPGDRVPSARQITREWGVAIATATRALAALRDEGLDKAVPGVGTVVHAPGHRPSGGRPARSGELTAGAIVAAAIALADTEGLTAVSMRRLASELGVATMALYRHVRSRDELVVLMVDEMMGGTPPPDPPPPGWRARLEAIARLQWATYRSHPWLAPAIAVTRPQVAPRGMVHTEYTLRALDNVGLDQTTRAHAAIGLIAYVRGMAVSFEEEARARQDTGVTEEEWIAAQTSAYAAAFAAGPYPALARLAMSPDIDLSLESVFEFGLRRMLDGYAVLIDGPSTAPSIRRRGRRSSVE